MSPAPMNILHLEDSARDAELIAELLHSDSPQFHITRAATRQDYEAMLQQGGFDLIISDFSLPDFTGLAALDLARCQCPEVPFIFLSGMIGEDRAVEALKSGAVDYVFKDRPARLASAIRTALDQRESKRARQRSDEALRQSQERFRQITENVADLIAALDLEGRRVYTNPAYRILGTPEALVGTSSFADIHPEDRPRIEALFRETVRSGSGHRAEFRLILPDGSFRHLDSQSGAIRDHAGTIVNVLVVSRDVTEKKQAVEEIERQRAFLRKVIDLDRNFIYAKDREGRYILANRAVASFHRTTVEGLLGRTDRDFGTSLVDVERFNREEQRVIETREESRTPAEHFIDPAGNVRWFDVLRHPLGTEDGQAQGVLGFGIEITEQRNVEQRLREQASLLDKARDVIAVTDLAHRITYWNPSAERVYGWTSAEAVGQDLRQLIYRHAADPFDTARAQLLATGEWRGELSPIAKNGTPMTVESTWSLVNDAAGNPTSILCIDTNVTEQRRLTLQLERAQRLESIGMLAGGIAHDLNNALSPILMGTELLRQMVSDPDAIALLQTLETSARHGASLVRQVLAFSRGVEGERGLLQLRHVLSEVEQFLLQTLDRNITIRVQSERDLPPILADATQLKQVLLNLSVNARDAMPQGGTLELTAVRCQVDADMATAAGSNARAGAHVRLSIQDSGAGIPPDVLERIFDPFFTTKLPGKGTGLGLSIVHGIIKGHGGFIQVESHPGLGSSFHLYLPVAESTCPDPVDTSSSPLKHGHGEEVLVIDDETGARTVLQSLLATYGYRVRAVADGMAGLAELRRTDRRVDIVLTDLMMPGLSGNALVNAIRASRPTVPIVVMSGLGDAESLPPGVPLLTKPLAASVLLEMLDEALKSRA